MGRRVFVGRLPKDSTERELTELFAQAGTVKQVSIKFDRDTGRQRGFAFVTMASEEEASRSIRQLNGSLLRGRNIRVVEAERRPERGADDKRDDEAADDEFVTPRTDELVLPQSAELLAPTGFSKGPATLPPGVPMVVKGPATIPPGTTAAIYGVGVEGLDPESLAGGLPAAAGRGRLWLGLAAVAAVGLGAAALAVYRQAVPATDARALVVAPAQVFGQSEGADYFGHAFAEAIAVNLAPIEALKVLPVPAQDELHGQSPVQWARRLGAGRLITGSITRTGNDRLAASLTMVATEENRVVWGIQRDSADGDVRALATLLARDVAGELGVQPPKRYEYVLSLDGGGRIPPAELAPALTALRRGDFLGALQPTADLVQRHPDQSDAAVLRAHALVLRWDAEQRREFSEELEKGLADIDRLDPQNPYAPVYRAIVVMRRAPSEARQQLGVVLARQDLSPTNRAWVLRYRAAAHEQSGRLDAALDDLHESLALDPTNSWTLSILSVVLGRNGRLEEAVTRAQQGLAVMPGFWRHHQQLGEVLTRLGRKAEAAAAFGRGCELGQSQVTCSLWTVSLLKVGQRDAAAKAAARTATHSPTVYGAYNLGCYHALRGETEAALRWLRTAVELGLSDAILGEDADLASVRREPEFQKLWSTVRTRLAQQPSAPPP